MTAAMSIEAYRGSASPFKKELHEIRPSKEVKSSGQNA
jgi:histidine ammonia-lyase